MGEEDSREGDEVLKQKNAILEERHTDWGR